MFLFFCLNNPAAADSQGVRRPLGREAGVLQPGERLHLLGGIRSGGGALQVRKEPYHPCQTPAPDMHLLAFIINEVWWLLLTGQLKQQRSLVGVLTPFLAALKGLVWTDVWARGNRSTS